MRRPRRGASCSVAYSHRVMYHDSMTTVNSAMGRVVPITSQVPTSARSLALQMALEEERQREVGARLRALRGAKPQPVVADEIGVTLRAYQRWEAGGGIAWQNLQAIAELYEVSENWLLYGDEETRGPRSQLDRIEDKLDRLVVQVNSLTVPTLDEAYEGTPAAGALARSKGRRGPGGRKAS